MQWALDWLWNFPEVSVVLSGMGAEEQVRENLAYAEASAAGCLSGEDLAMLECVRAAYLEETRSPAPSAATACLAPAAWISRCC